ncbi:MAG: hypothetical protein ABSC06_04400 [Rhodopila sp.]
MERNIVRAGTLNMLGGIRGGILAVCVGVMMAQPAYADNPTFADLLAQAKAQAATGHRWAPPGDNMTETVMKMMDLIPTATPAEIAQLSALLESDKSGPPPLPPLDSSTGERPADSALAPAPPATETPPAPAPTESALLPAAPAAQTPPAAPAPTESALAPAPPAPAAQTPPALAPTESALALAPPAAPTSPKMATAAPPQFSAMPDRLGSEGGHQVRPNAIGPSHIGPSPIAPSPIAASPAEPTPRDHAAALFAQGLDAEIRGDLSGARRYYLVAAKDGDAAAARNLGRLYDPAYLKQTAIGGVDPDAALAREWYERAFRLGDPEAGLLLEALSER